MDKITPSQSNTRTVDISVTQWHELAHEGIFAPVTIKLYGSSMQPTIKREKDFVTIVPLNRALKKGDVVLFARKDGAYVVHRVWKAKNNTVTTVGDHCADCDAPMPLDCVWGLAIRVEKNGKIISLDSANARAYGKLLMHTRRLRFNCRRITGFCKRIFKKR